MYKIIQYLLPVSAATDGISCKLMFIVIIIQNKRLHNTVAMIKLNLIKIKDRVGFSNNFIIFFYFSGVPIVPGTDGPISTKEEAKEFCMKHGLPIIFKVSNMEINANLNIYLSRMIKHFFIYYLF